MPIFQSQFNISHLFARLVCFILTMNRSLLGAITPGHSLPGRNGNDGALHFPQISLAGASLSDGLMSYQRHTSVGMSYPSTEMKSMYFTAKAKCAI